MLIADKSEPFGRRISAAVVAGDLHAPVIGDCQGFSGDTCSIITSSGKDVRDGTDIVGCIYSEKRRSTWLDHHRISLLLSLRFIFKLSCLDPSSPASECLLAQSSGNL